MSTGTTTKRTNKKPPVKQEPPKRTLWNITDDLLEKLNVIEEAGGEIDPAIMDALRDNEQEMDQKLDNYCSLIESLSARAEARKEQAKRIAALVKSDENKAKRLKTNLLIWLGEMNLKGHETPNYKINKQDNGGLIPLIVDIEPHLLADEYRSVTYSPNQTAIRADIERGKEVPGCRLGERGEQVRIK